MEGKDQIKNIHPDFFERVDFVGAKGLVFIGEKILVYRRDHNTSSSPGCLDLPGGGREGNETPCETFIREVKEEFNLDVGVDMVESSTPIQSAIVPQRQSFFTVVRMPVSVEENIRLGNEGSEWLLITLDDFLSRTDGISRQQERVKDWLEGRELK